MSRQKTGADGQLIFTVRASDTRKLPIRDIRIPTGTSIGSKYEVQMSTACFGKVGPIIKERETFRNSTEPPVVEVEPIPQEDIEAIKEDEGWIQKASNLLWTS